LRTHPAYDESVARLTRAGVCLMDPDAVTVRAEDGLATFDWPQILSTLSGVLSSGRSSTVARSG
jgi:hypothetical protein